MMVEALSRYHVKITDDNICDAFCLTHFGEAWYAANAFGRTAGGIGITKASMPACPLPGWFLAANGRLGDNRLPVFLFQFAIIANFFADCVILSCNF